MTTEIHSAVLKLIIRYGDLLSRIASQNLPDRPTNLRQNEVFKWRETLATLDDIRNHTIGIPWMDLTDVELLLLGFKLWKDDEPLRLIPGHLFRFLPQGMKLTAIDGEVVTLGESEMDLSTGLGCLAYGWIGKDKRGESDVSKPV